MNCPHYNRNCSFVAPCCNKIYGCRHCHDDIEANIIENNILVPKIMQKTVGLNPVISISALLIGGKLGGLFGAILAIPIAAALSAIVEDIFNRKITEETKLEE